MKNSFRNHLPRFIQLLLVLAALVRTSDAFAQAYWQQEVDYKINVTLNDSAHTLDAFEQLDYTNHSPDTLRFIWFHLWPNAYKTDRTAFSEQMLLNNRTDFYFAPAEQRGYINRLRFQVDGVLAETEDHPQYIDVIKLWLPAPLAPGAHAMITTPFHVQLPANFSRGGHTGQSYQMTQWYPKPAVYDRKGWHEMPYLDQGEFYAEFGRFDVSITVPSNYVVAATGKLESAEERKWLEDRSRFTMPPPERVKSSVVRKGTVLVKKPVSQTAIPSAATLKTLRYTQDRVHDFAWFADKRYRVGQDTVRLPSGRSVRMFSYYLPADTPVWKGSLGWIRETILSRSSWLGEYPYETVSAVEAQMGFPGGMEYPTITAITPMASEEELRFTIGHEVGHNWLYGVLASNERDHPWMDEGMNTYYDGRPAPAAVAVQKGTGGKQAYEKDRQYRAERDGFETFAGVKKDQPIETRSDDFSRENYALVAYFKTGEWMRRLEQALGQPLFDSCMRTYFRQWAFRHPYPEDFRRVMEETSQRDLGAFFRELDRKGSLDTLRHARLRVQPGLPWSGSKSSYFLSVAPALGYNLYDGLMAGVLVHNYQLPLKPFSFLVAPVWGFKSSRPGGLARASYTWYPDKGIYKVTAGVAGAVFSIREFQPAAGAKLYPGVRKLAPYVRLTLHESPLSRRERFVQVKSYLISEGNLQFGQRITGTDTSEVVSVAQKGYVVNQLRLVLNEYRVLYPYGAELQVEQHRDFVRTAFTGRYFFNYASRDGGLGVRFFAGKFSYTGRRSTLKQFETDRFHLNMTGPKGEEDYTYSNYFAGRNSFEGLASQQIMMRDGGFKVRTDLLSAKVGKTDNWLTALNFTAGIPRRLNPLSVLPFALPLKVFADVGTYAGAWDRDARMDRFLFDAGLQLSLFKETLNIYVPLAYSRVYRDYFRSTLGDHRFGKTISFSLDLQQLSWRKLDPGIPF